MPRLRKPKLTFANVTSVAALVIATSTGTAYAGTLIGSSDIKSGAIKTRHLHGGAVTAAKVAGGAITTSKVANGAITRAKLAPSARSNVIRYSLGSHDFSGTGTVCGHVSGAIRLGSSWLAELDNGSASASSTAPGENFSGVYGVFVYDAGDGVDICVELMSGVGAQFDHVFVFRTPYTSSVTTAPARVVARQSTGH